MRAWSTRASFFTLLRPLPLVFGLLGLAAFLLHGATWAALKTEGELQERTRKAAKALVAVAMGAFFVSYLAVWAYLPGAVKRVPAWIFAVLGWASLGLILAALKKGKDGRAFLFSSTFFLSLWGTVGAVHYPHLVRATDPALSLTITNASSSALTLKVMLVIALVGMPLVVWYTIYAYRVFKGKVRTDGDGILRLRASPSRSVAPGIVFGLQRHFLSLYDGPESPSGRTRRPA